MTTPEQRYVTLNSGVRMPAIGLGCWSGTTTEQHESATPWVVSALKIGYRHLDTAHGYGTEGPVGRAIRESGVPREEVFVTTKLPSHHHAKVAESLEESLQRFGFDYFDLYLMHWPQAHPNIDENPDPRHPSISGVPNEGHYMVVDSPTFNETWADMEKLLETGKVKAIGVSNFSVKNLMELLKTAKIIPAVNQVEMHPHQAQPGLLKLCREEGIMLTAYSPSGYGQVRDDPTIRTLAEKYGVSPAQISHAWHLARQTTAVPKSTNAERQRGNLWELPTLTTEEVDLINTLHKDVHYCQYGGPKDDPGPKRVFGWTYEQMGW